MRCDLVAKENSYARYELLCYSLNGNLPEIVKIKMNEND